MIKPICCRCKQELIDFGGILLSPPDKYNKAVKKHICKNCYKILALAIKTYLLGERSEK